MDSDAETGYQQTFTKTFIGQYKLVNTCVQINLQFRGIGALQSMAQNSNTESTPEEIREISTSNYESLYKFSKLNSSAECRQCKKIYKFDQRKTGYKTLSEHYRKHHKNLSRPTFEEDSNERGSSWKGLQ